LREQWEKWMQRLIMVNYKTEHKFHVVGDGINIPYDGILGKNFFDSKQATINYVRKEIIMDKVILKFDDTAGEVKQCSSGHLEIEI
jgi:hypothetical protein